MRTRRIYNEEKMKETLIKKEIPKTKKTVQSMGYNLLKMSNRENNNPNVNKKPAETKENNVTRNPFLSLD